MTKPIVVVIEEPTEEHRLAVLEPLGAFNNAQAGPVGMRPVAIMLNDASGRSVGGLWGHTAYDWMFVQYLAVPEACRGQDLGTCLMLQAEQLARMRGCIGIWLDTFSFQALGFYKKLGYSVFGVIEDYPIGHQRLFLSKRL
jgi:GNAT superfamily N-acetyltransferase